MAVPAACAVIGLPIIGLITAGAGFGLIIRKTHHLLPSLTVRPNLYLPLHHFSAAEKFVIQKEKRLISPVSSSVSILLALAVGGYIIYKMTRPTRVARLVRSYRSLERMFIIVSCMNTESRGADGSD